MKAYLGNLRRRFTTLLTALTFIVLAVTGVLAFVRPFSIKVVGLHSLLGFLFIVLVGLHALSNIRPLKRYLRSRAMWVTLAITATLSGIFWWQPEPVRALLGLSGNLGPALERFEMGDGEMVFQYSPSTDYKMALTIKTGRAFDPGNPPQIAIWLENQGAYHIKTLLSPGTDHAGELPFWGFKWNGWEKAKREAEEESGEAVEVDGVSGATPNGSFDPADYILPADPENSTPFKLLIEINQVGDRHGQVADQPSLVYSVEIDNGFPQAFQLLDLVGYPKREDSEGKEKWAVYYVDEGFGSALELIDSALLTIERRGP